MRLGRIVVLLVLVGLGSTPAGADEKADLAKLDKKVYDALRELHNRGADIYNNNELEGAYRYFQATIGFARAMLDHRPALQKAIDDGMLQAERQVTIAKKTFALHLLVEKIRDQLRGDAKPRNEPVEPKRMELGPESIKTAPRELPPVKIDGPHLPPPPKKREDPLMSLSRGVGGRILYKGKYLPGISVVFVTRDQPRLLTFETSSDRDGYYRLEEVIPGKYTILLAPTQDSPVKSLPERYAALTTSSFVVETRGNGEILDIVLQ